MLPKVATQILHSTGRAVSSLQHQSCSIRNVLQSNNTGLAPWNSPSSSHRGNKGGSARYSGAGRAVTHANAAFPAHDGAFVQSDDQDEPAPRRHAPLASARIRSSSLSIPARPSILKAVQLHARARHAFAAANADQHPVTSPQDPPIPPSDDQQISHAAKRLLEARRSGNSVRAAEAVREFRQSVVHPSVREFNAALEALQATRRPGEPLNLLLETYNDMLRHSLLPNARTYVALIDSLTARDNEVHSAIAAIHRRIQYRALTGFTEPVADQADRSRIEMLRRENNFSTAISLFDAVLSIDGNRSLLGHTYMSLLRSCALNSNVDAAIKVWDQLQKRDDFFPSSAMFLEMIRVYTNAGQLSDAEQIFSDYKSALQRGNIYISWSRDQTDPNRLNLFVWNQMIETYFRFDRPDKAVALVDQMLQSDISQLQQQVVADPPPVASATFTAVLTGFCQIGDVDTALVWFDKLLAQPPSSQDPFKPVGVAMKPDEVAWQVMLDALAVKGMLHDLNRLFSLRLAEDPRHIRVPQRTVVYSANMAQLPSMDDQEYTRTLSWLQAHVLNSPEFKLKHRFNLTADIATAYLERKMYTKAFDFLYAYLSDFIKGMTDKTLGLGMPPPLSQVQEMQLKFTDKLYQVSQGNVPYSISMQLARLAVTLRITQPPSFVPFFLHSYALNRASQNLPVTEMTRQDWELLLMAANSFESLHDTENPPEPPIPDFAYQGLASVIRDLADFKVDLNKMNKDLVRQVIAQLSQRLGSDGMRALIKETGFISVLTDLDHAKTDEDSASETSGADSGYASEAPFKTDFVLSKKIIETVWPGPNLDEAMNTVYIKFQKAVKAGRCPRPAALAVLISWNARWGRMDEIRFTYSVAQRMLRTLENDKVAQTAGWLEIENAMVSALAQCGDIEGAHQYRQRILANGGVPNAQAYGALIYAVKDTTDDASSALELFQESQNYHVKPTQYLYNNIISKLAKARKADYALELFKQMKQLKISPTSVTFGAVIGACARVGDLHSAEALFVEMTQDPHFKPRIPPYNTMMQMYTTTKPDRDRVLYYYGEMCKVNILPSAHTYKLLIDAYGSVEPIDLEGMTSVFERLRADKRVVVQGVHYAALINAYGCASKDLDKAIEVFNNMDIPHDSIVYETMFTVFTVQRRADLIRHYLNKMQVEGVRMTAYIANSLIKSYSLLDDIEEARKLFESLEDPPEGVAAPNNRAPHTSSQAPSAIDPDTPVYREPSTWEAMVRAELGSGNRDGASALLERLKARQYPEAVFNRISGILVDHSQVPL